MAYIEANNIHKTFGKGDAAVHALRGASLSVDKGEMVAVMGKSGSGKSTLLNILGGLMTMDEGELRVGGKKVDFVKRNICLTTGITVEKAVELMQSSGFFQYVQSRTQI